MDNFSSLRHSKRDDDRERDRHRDDYSRQSHHGRHPSHHHPDYAYPNHGHHGRDALGFERDAPAHQPYQQQHSPVSQQHPQHHMPQHPMQPHSQHSGFSLRSPVVQTDYRQQQAPVAHFSPNPNAHHGSPTSRFSTHFAQPGTPSARPTVVNPVAPPPAYAPSARPGEATTAATTMSPLRPSSGYYQPEYPHQDYHQDAPGQKGPIRSFYDPLAETRDRRASDAVSDAVSVASVPTPTGSWAVAQQQARDSYYNSTQSLNGQSPKQPQQPQSALHHPASSTTANGLYRDRNPPTTSDVPLTVATSAAPTGSLDYTSPVSLSRPPKSPRSQSSRPTPQQDSHHRPDDYLADQNTTPPPRALAIALSPSGAQNGPSVHSSGLVPLAPPRPPPAMGTPGRDPAQLMSFSNILSNSAEPARRMDDSPPLAPPRTRPIGEPQALLPAVMIPDSRGDDNEMDLDDEASHPKKDAKKDRPHKQSKPRASTNASLETPKSRRVSAKKDVSPRLGAKRQVNGQPKIKESDMMDQEVQRMLLQIEEDSETWDDQETESEEGEIQMIEHAAKRLRLFYDGEVARRASRREELIVSLAKKLESHSDLGRRRFEDIHYDDALQEVRDRELYAEKERKKDMQRKRRREKSMAATMEAKNIALARAEAAQTESERQKHLRDAERANKKAQQTQLVLEKGIKGPARNFIDLQLDGGGQMSSFLLSELDAQTPAKASGGGDGGGGGGASKKNRSGNRPKKSREQKEAEKEKAAAAQAALDAGMELPTQEETRAKIKLTVKPSKGKEKEKDRKDKDRKDKDKDNRKGGKDSKIGGRGGSMGAGGGDDEEAMLSDLDEDDRDMVDEGDIVNGPRKDGEPRDKFSTKGYKQIYDQIWRDLARKDVYKTSKMAAESQAVKTSNLKKTALLASKEAKRWQQRTNKGTKDQQARAKRVMRDMMSFWKRNEREERDLRKAAEKQELENARKEEADREAARQKRKLNFLISQTELYSHFIGKKIKTDEVERSTDSPGVGDKAKKEENKSSGGIMDIIGDEKAAAAAVGATKVTNFENLDFDAEDETALRAAAMANAQNAIAEAQKKARDFNKDDKGLLDMDEEGEMNFQNPTGLGDVEIEQPRLLNAQLKEYQLKGLNWLVNLYEQGINGILADEMGLGKTVQSISVMAYLAEKYDVWGPFLVVAPASTLHNWEQEIRKFVPEFKILPYWGSAADRKVLRKFWDRKHSTYKREASFHVCVTSYQMVVSDVAYFQKMKWQYMILDEAQAIKSSASSRWKCLLSFHCRNRLLLTGTPIQNNMQELWALLHFIMPSLFDSHDEFSEWFSKDIESHATSNTKLNEDQLKRLHMILKPFMLRRVKKHVQKELGDKIELDVFCDLTHRQRAYYANLRNQISIMDLIEKATMGGGGDDNDSGTLMNLVMQFRKVCNHPDLFERADTKSPFAFGYFAETASFVREGSSIAVGYTTRNLIEYELPRRVWVEGGRLDRPGPDNEGAGWRGKILGHMMNVWEPENVKSSSTNNTTFSWLRFADMSPAEVSRAARQDVFARAVECAHKQQQQQRGSGVDDRLGRMAVVYDDNNRDDAADFTPAHALFLIRARRGDAVVRASTTEGILNRLMGGSVARAAYSDSGLDRLEQAGRPRASAPPIEVVCSSPATRVEKDNILFNPGMRKALYGPNIVEERALVSHHVEPTQFPLTRMLPAPDKEKARFNNIVVPSMRHFIQASGKLAKLDELLFKMKNEGHRVLLYFQMTRMIDLMEEYLTYRNYKYCRLDGSTKLEDRRDTVADFQTRPEIFIFLLSTRAGGLGINLTTADTVIFYDSDWNPTIDSQAMDRAHRLGQTKQVTVYRLITRGTIEERIRKRAMQKEEVQRVVIQGGGASVDFSGRRPAENRNRDIAMWLADDDQAAEIERREKEMLESGEYEKMQQKRKGGKRKRNQGGEVSLDDMYHEGEGHFDDGNGNGTGAGTATATPAETEGKGKKRRVGGKKAKTAKQRLAMADGEVD